MRVAWRMSRKSGYRFSEKDMRKRNNPERIPTQSKRDALQRMQGASRLMAKKASKAGAKTKAAQSARSTKSKQQTATMPKAKSAPKAATKRTTDAAEVAVHLRDGLDDLIESTARTLALPVDAQWLPAIKVNLLVTLEHAALVSAFSLPDDAEPAPIFEA
jgi:1-carboxybiuret hydrolase subunit AtzG-like